MNLWLLLFLILSIAFGIESGKIRPNFDEIFGGEWDKKESEKMLIKIEQNEPNMKSQAAVDQICEEMGTDPNDQQKREIIRKFEAIKEKLKQKGKYQNKYRTKIEFKIGSVLGASRHKIYKWKKELNLNKVKIENIHFIDQMDGENLKCPNDQQKIETIQKFERIKEKLKENGKYQWKNRVKIETKIGKLLGESREKIYKWKKELNLNKKIFYDKKKREFIERIDEFKSLYGQGKQNKFMKELGISKDTFVKWKKELVPKYHKKHFTNEKKLQKVKKYFKIKERNAEISGEKIAKKLGIPSRTLRMWKKKFASISEI